MKLQELAVANPTKQAAKVFESYFGDSFSFETLSQQQSRGMLKRVRNLIAEHRRSAEFHHSEQNPAYLKLIMMEQALAGQATAPGTVPVDPAKAAALATAQQQQKKRQLQDEIKQLQAQISEKQKQMNMPTMAPMESRLYRRLHEASEVQQAQVVLASQDMVDQVQKMSEQISAMQFKDLPALVDQIKNEVGVDQAMQFNTDATAALAGLLQNLQGAKQQLEAALGVVTGQAATVPGADMTAEPMAEPELGAEMGAEELPAELPAPEEEESDTLASSLGRGRR